METFFLQDNSGLCLTNHTDNNLSLAEQNFSSNQTWYWQGNMLRCGTGRVLDVHGSGCWMNVEASTPWPDRENQHFYFQNIDNGKVIIGRFAEKDGEKDATIPWHDMTSSSSSSSSSNFENSENHYLDNQHFFCVEKKGESWQPIMSTRTSTNTDLSWRKVSTEQAYKWKLMNSEELPEGALATCSTDVGHDIFIGRGFFEGKHHLGKVQDEKRYIGFHNEDSMANETFYLRNESGLYLTNVTNTIQLVLAELESSPNQIWYWKKRERGTEEEGKRNGEKNILMCGTHNSLHMFYPGRETHVVVGHMSMPENAQSDTFYFNHSEDGSFLIGQYFYKNDDLYLTFKKEYTEYRAYMVSIEDSSAGFRWRTENAKYDKPYNWVVMDSEELPSKALEMGKGRSETGDTASIFMGLGEVNGYLHPGKVVGVERQIGYQCRTRLGFIGIGFHCSHCCFPPHCEDSYHNYNEDNVRKVTSEKFSVLCVDPETKVEWIKFENASNPKSASVSHTHKYDWSKFPNDAVMAGISLGYNSICYVGRGLIGDQLVPGLFVPSYEDTKLDVIHDGKMHELSEFEVLVVKKGHVDSYLKAEEEKLYHGIDNEERPVTSEEFAVLCIEENACVRWDKYEEKIIPNGAVIGGIFDGQIHYVGRGKLDGQTMPGMFLAQKQTLNEYDPHTLFVLHDGKTREVQDFEVLVAETKNNDAQVLKEDLVEIQKVVDSNTPKSSDIYTESGNPIYQWSQMCVNSLPKNAIFAGKDQSETFNILIGRDTVSGHYKLSTVQLSCYVAHDGEEKQIQDYEVLCVDPEAIVYWIESNSGNVPYGALVGSIVDGKPQYVGRGKTQNQITPGKIVPEEGCMYASYGDEVHSLDQYEVLVIMEDYEAIKNCELTPKGDKLYQWMKIDPNKYGMAIPGNILGAGKDQSETFNIFVGRGEFDGHQCLGKVHLSLYVEEKMEQILGENVEVLCGDPDAIIEWVDSTEDGQIPSQAVVGSIVNGKKEYVGRGTVGANLIPGRIVPDDGCLHAPYGMQGWICKQYQFLVIKKLAEEKPIGEEIENTKATKSMKRIVREVAALISVENEGDDLVIPEGFEIVDIDENNFSQHRQQIETIIKKQLKNGTIKFIKKTEKPREEATLGDLFNVMGGLMTVFAPEEDAQKIQEQVGEMSKLFSSFKLDVKTEEE